MRFSRRSRGSSDGRSVTPLIVAVGLLVTTIAVQSSIADSEERRNALTARTEQLRLSIQDQLSTLEVSVAEQRNWLIESWPVSRQTYHDVATLAAAARIRRGVQASTVVRAVAADETDAFVAAVRQDRSIEPDGYPAFEVRPPESDHDIRYIVEYIEPLAGNEAAFGFDIGSDAARREAVEAARDRGTTVATKPIRLVQDGDDARSILLLDPIYDNGEVPSTRPARRRHFVGVQSTAIRIDDLLRDVRTRYPAVTFEVYDVGPTVDEPSTSVTSDDLLIDTDGDAALVPGTEIAGLHNFADLDVGGRRWRITVAPRSAFDAGQNQDPLVIAAIGLVLVALLASALGAAAKARARAERLVERRTTELQRLIQQSPDATVVVASDGRIVLASDMVEPLLGYRPDELIGQHVEILVPEAKREGHVSLRLSSPDGFRRMGGGLDLEARKKSGDVVPVEISLSPLPESDDFGRVVASLRDVSVQREAQEEMRRAIEQKTQFLATVSHELRTPLTAIRGFTKLLVARHDSIDHDTQLEFLQRIQRNTDALHGLIEEVLEYSRLERHAVKLAPADTRVDHLVTSVVDQLQTLLGAHDVEVDVEPTAAYIDASAMTRVLSNLLTNSARYAPAGSKIVVRTRTVDTQARLIVDDAGPGIPLADRPHIFDRFWRGQHAQENAIGGTGIGLAIVAELCALQSSRVEVGDSPLGGARFTVTMPKTAGGRPGGRPPTR